MLPKEVLEEAHREFFNYRNSGVSVFELNHRSALFNDVVNDAKDSLRKLLNIPDNYSILFLQGGASLQFAAVPMNLMKKGKAGFIITGHWARRAYEEAQMYGEAIELASSEDRSFTYIPDCSNMNIPNDLDYIHICENNTIYGTQYKSIPNTKGIDLVSDMSSCILSEPINISKYALIYAGAQKNIGPAGMTLVIVRNDLIRDDVRDDTPLVMRYKKQADADSRFNTPPCYSIYLCGLVLKWLIKIGGLSAIYEINKEKAHTIYEYLDESILFHGIAEREYRSSMNATFTSGDSELDMEIVEDSKQYGFISIKGHRFIGGLRASLYNAIPVSNVKALVDYLWKFEKEHTKGK